MSYLVDTDRVADYLKGRPDAVDQLTALAPEGMSISLVTYGEIYEGIYFGRDPAHQEASFRAFLRFTDTLGLTRAVMKRFARVRGELRALGQLIGDPDLIIAATALHHDLTLVTRNYRHFERVPGLRYVDDR